MIWQTIFQPLTFQQKKARSHHPSCFRETRCGQNTLQKTSWQERKQFNSTRNMFGYTGFYRDKPISVKRQRYGLRVHGHLFPRADEFLWRKEADYAGAMQKTTHIRDIGAGHGRMHRHRLCKGAGASRRLFLRIADFGLLIKAALEAEQRGLSYHVGNVLTSDVFYARKRRRKKA